MIDNYSVTLIKDLGIVFHFNMDFSIHINSFIKKSFQILRFINSNTVILKYQRFKILYFLYFSHINHIENVHYTFLKLLC